MSTKKIATHETSNTSTHATHAAAATAQPVGPPPAGLVIPAPPAGFTNVKGGVGRGVRPRKSEVIVISEAADELRRFVDWQATLGKAAPAQATIVAAFDTASQWTIMRASAKTWGAYASNEEGLAWTGVRAFMAVVKPLLMAAVTADPSLATTYPKLCALFGAKSGIAKKAVSTKAANKKKEAAGQPATHGVVGKKRQHAAALAALAEKEAAAAAVPSKPGTTDGPPAVNVVNGSNGTPAVNGSNGLAHV